jgi:hypothetical protein
MARVNQPIDWAKPGELVFVFTGPEVGRTAWNSKGDKGRD